MTYCESLSAATRCCSIRLVRGEKMVDAMLSIFCSRGLLIFSSSVEPSSSTSTAAPASSSFWIDSPANNELSVDSWSLAISLSVGAAAVGDVGLL